MLLEDGAGALLLAPRRRLLVDMLHFLSTRRSDGLGAVRSGCLTLIVGVSVGGAPVDQANSCAP